MGCFSLQKSRKGGPDVQARTSSSSSISLSMSVESEAQEENRSAGGGSSCSFRSKSKNAQRFMNGNPKLSSSSHPGYGRRSHRDGVHGASSSSSSFFNLLGRRTRSVTEMEVQSHVSAMAATPCPVPLPFPPRPSPNPSAYRLPRPHKPAPSPPRPSSSISHNIPRSMYFKTGSSCSTKAPCRADVPTCNPQPLPRPPRETLTVLRAFTYAELETACNSFSSDSCVGNSDTQIATYEGVLWGNNAKPEKQTKITIVRVFRTSWKQSFKEWHAKLEVLGRLHDDHHLCKILGYHAEDEGTERFLVYQRLAKGSLDSLLYGKKDSPPLDWSSRMKIAMGAAQDLAFLHEREPEPITYGDFGACHIYVDTDFSAKLSGYGFSSASIESAFASQEKVEAIDAPEHIWSCDQGSPSRSSDVWSFGVILLELLTGRKNMDLQVPKEERNLVRWTRPYLRDEGRLFLIMDPKLRGKFQARGAKMVGVLAHRCLQKDFSQRPAMREVLEAVKLVQSVRYSFRFPSRDVTSSSIIAGAGSGTGEGGRKSISKPDSVSTDSMEIKTVTKFDVIENPTLKPLIVPPRSSCSWAFAMKEEERTTGPQHSSRVHGRLESF